MAAAVMTYLRHQPTERVGAGAIRRIVEGRWFAVLVSLALHATVFAMLTRVTWQEEPASRRTIIGGAWLGPAGDAASDGALRGRPVRAPAARLARPPVGAAVPGAGDAMSRTREGDLAALVSSLDLDEPVANEDVGIGGGELSPGLSLTGAGGGGEGSGTFGGGLVGSGRGFFGVAGNARRIVYVIDTSESLVWLLEPLRRELIASIEGLKPVQQFHVILAYDRPMEMAPGRLVPAIAHYKEPAKAFVRQIVPRGACDPVAAMERAFAAEPELIYFLTDGDLQKYSEELLAKLRAWNADRRVVITTIGFGVKLTRSRLQDKPVGEALLRQIAEEHGGHFRWVSDDEVARE